MTEFMLNGACPNSRSELQGRPYATIARTCSAAIDCGVPQLQLVWRLSYKKGARICYEKNNM